ncbi:MAG: 30S ribosomal protein S17 [Candidatus Aenigmarchaeota archaeon]|nr:30S ribosomal protein S17 [Candidatus Aenigmarchaeota archaeon]
MKKEVGLNIKMPEKKCSDKNCPFHGTLSLRGKILQGTVVSDRMQKSVIVERTYLHYLPKYERYERRHTRISAHNPPCINAKKGDKVKIAECRPLSKTKHFVVVEVMKK